MRARDGVRLGYGLTLLATPDRLVRTLTGTALDPPGRVVARILGARHVLQAALLIVHDRVWLRRAGRVVDLLHSASMLLLAALAPGRERVALTDALVARTLAGSAASTRRKATARPRGTGHQVAARGAEGGELVAAIGSSGARSRRERHALLQHAIHLTLQQASGRSRPDIRTALEENIAQHGLECPPAPWLEAVTEDLSRGFIYVVSGPAMQDIGARVPRGKPL